MTARPSLRLVRGSRPRPLSRVELEALTAPRVESWRRGSELPTARTFVCVALVAAPVAWVGLALADAVETTPLSVLLALVLSAAASALALVSSAVRREEAARVVPGWRR